MGGDPGEQAGPVRGGHQWRPAGAGPVGQGLEGAVPDAPAVEGADGNTEGGGDLMPRLPGIDGSDGTLTEEAGNAGFHRVSLPHSHNLR